MILIDDIDRACELMASMRFPPCGIKERPHLVAPETMQTGRGHCVTCGQTFDPDAPPSAANASASDR